MEGPPSDPGPYREGWTLESPEGDGRPFSWPRKVPEGRGEAPTTTDQPFGTRVIRVGSVRQPVVGQRNLVFLRYNPTVLFSRSKLGPDV